MKSLGGYTQKQLNEMWDSLDSDTPNSPVKRIVEDKEEEVMTINVDQGQISVSRKPGRDWFDTPSVGDRDE